MKTARLVAVEMALELPAAQERVRQRLQGLVLARLEWLLRVLERVRQIAVQLARVRQLERQRADKPARLGAVLARVPCVAARLAQV